MTAPTTTAAGPVTLTAADVARVLRLLAAIRQNANYLRNYAADIEEAESAAGIGSRARQIAAIVTGGAA